MSATESPTRVALLARPGPARESLRQALRDAGGEVVLEADPVALPPRAIADAAVEAVLVALDPVVEEALSSLDEVLHAPGVRLIFDEAELAATREGWAAQRWVRHLGAKLHGHADVLPPGAEADAPQPEPGRLPTPAQLQVESTFDTHLEEAEALASSLPSDGLPEATGFADILQDEPEAWTPREAASTLPDHFEWEAVALPAVPTPAPPVLAGSGAATSPDTPEPAAVRMPLHLELEALEPVSAPGQVGGAVLAIGGIGGPDAIRKLLGALPVGFDRPVLLKLRLDGGLYDNLARQMARVSPLPVVLAEPARPLVAGRAYVVPDGVGVAVGTDTLAFAEGVDDLQTIAALPAESSALFMLSGGDPGLVDAAWALAERGGLVLAQAAEGCYDPAGPNALAARGVDREQPADLATRLLQVREPRW